MHLKKLELYGFKSFADKVEISFDEGITGVVGPNGSGKSNIGDAMRWVLGESSARSLRGAKMEDVIFNGAQKRNPLGWCEVTLIFDNTDGKLPIEYSEVAISRRVYRNGEGEYLINRSACRRKDIVELFRDTGIGREGYSIIGQGRIADMLSHKPEERRDVFHEAAGIMKYRTRRDEAQSRLDTTRGNIQRLYDIMEEMERQLGPLKRQSHNARKYIEVSSSLKELEINVFLKEYDRLNAELHAAMQSVNEFETYTKQESDAIEKNKEQYGRLSASVQELEAEIARIRDNIDEMSEAISSSKGQELVLKERLSYAKQEQMRLFDEIELDNNRVLELKTEAQELKDALSGKGEDSQKIKQDIEDIKARIKKMAVDIDQRQQDIDLKKNIMMQELTQMSDMKSSSSRLEAMIEAYAQRKAELVQSLEEALRQKEIYDDVRGEMKDEVDSLESQIGTLQKSTDDDMQSREELRKMREECDSDLQSKHDRQRNLETRISMLQTLIADYDGFSNPVRFLFGLPEAKSLIEGVVADIIDVPKEYTSAVERALGNAMQHIVTRSDSEAKQLIKLLRTNQAGRATFLPVDAIEGRYLKEHEQHILNEEGCYGVAADLVGFDKKYSEIVYSLLGRTIICDNMDTAVSLAKKVQYSCKFATLAGDMVHPGGSMSGGSRDSKEYSPIARRNQLEELIKLNAEAKSDVYKAQNALDEIHKQMDAQKELIQIRAKQLGEMKVEYATQKERFDKLQTSTAENDGKIEEINSHIARLDENTSDAKQEIANIMSASQSAQKQDSVSREEITKSQMQVNDMRENRDQTQEHLDKLMSLDMADEKERAAVGQKIIWLESEAVRITALIEEKEKRHEENEQASQMQASELTDSKTTVEGSKTELENLRSSLSEKTDALDGQKKILASVQQLVTMSQNRQMELSDKRHEHLMRHERCQMELAQIQNRIWDYYELTYQGTLEFKNEELDLEGAAEKIETMRRQIKAMGTVNVNAVSDFAELNERYTEHKTQYDDLIKAESDLLKIIEGLNKQMREKFLTEFNILNEYFTENFAKLFGGGKAFLTLSDEDDVLNSGIIIEAQPPGKKLQMLSLLSGGEKALTATAILFAMLRHRPSPFCLLDEIETALDDANLYHFTDFLKGYAKDTQFVVITHRRPTMESCDILYGVTMEEKGVSKMISVKIADYK